VERPEFTCRVSFGGHTEHYHDKEGIHRARWANTNDVLAIPFDMPISGYRNHAVNTLRLWKSAATDDSTQRIQRRQLHRGGSGKEHAEHISMVLYPNDSSETQGTATAPAIFLASAVCRMRFGNGARPATPIC